MRPCSSAVEAGESKHWPGGLVGGSRGRTAADDDLSAALTRGAAFNFGYLISATDADPNGVAVGELNLTSAPDWQCAGRLGSQR